MVTKLAPMLQSSHFYSSSFKNNQEMIVLTVKEELK